MTRIISTVLLGAGLLAGVTTMPSSEAHDGHEGHNHGPAEVVPRQFTLSEKSPGIVTTPPPFETLEDAPADSRALSEQNYDREQAPTTRDWRQPSDRPFQPSQPPITPQREFDDHPRLQATPRSFEQYPRNHRLGPRSNEDVSPQASPLPGCTIGCPLDASTVDRYGNSLLPGSAWSCPQFSICKPAAGQQIYHYFAEVDCHANEVVRSHYPGIDDHSYSFGYSDRY